ncbi:hypothetical protein, partial [Pseudomonas sp.]|uniref:hypothetical protein n=1 Tax=Pseudomonas sp. TaxID=306 RepID=UPI003FD6D9DB
PQMSDASGGGQAAKAMGETRHGSNLNDFAMLAGWNTPDSTMMQAKSKPPVIGNRKPTDPQISLADQAFHLAGWATPKACDGKGNAYEPDPECRRVELRKQVILCGPARSTVSGQMLTGSDAEMGSGGQLNPAHSRWLMALPREWDDCAPTETLSMLKRRRSL